MKCSNCPFLENAGTYEYRQMVCKFFYCDVPEEFTNKDDDGCNLKFKEAEKLASLEIPAMYNSYIEELKKRRK